MSAPIAAAPPAQERTLVSAIWPLLLIMALMLMLSLLSVLVVSGLRAYIYGQARWSIGEHQAAEQLHRYAIRHDPVNYQQFLEQMAVPQGDRMARLQLLRAHPDYELARRGLLAGANAPADVTGMIVLFRLFQHQALMAHAISVWSAADTYINALQQCGMQLHAQIVSGHPDPQQVNRLLAQIDDLHQRVVPLEEEFGATLGTASRQIGGIVLVVLPLGCALLLLAGISRSRAQFRRDQRMGNALRELATSLHHQATHDALTNLTNRAEFEVLLEIAIAERIRGAAHWWAAVF
jgi:hypothetical protein